MEWVKVHIIGHIHIVFIISKGIDNMKKIPVILITACIILIIVCYCVWKEEKANPKGNKELDFTKIDRLSLWAGNDELFTEDKDIIKKMFPKDCTYTEEYFDNEYAGAYEFNAYDGKKLLYEIFMSVDEHICINNVWYTVENPPDYQEVSHLIQEENKD